MKQILIVEDEPDIQELLCAYIQNAGYKTAAAGDGEEALRLFADGSFDLVLLDIMLPGMNGFQVCERIRIQSQVPILMLTALDGEAQQLRGLGLNADDYITKPFSMPVLLEKIRVILRRSTGTGQEEILRYRDLSIIPDTREAILEGKPANLTFCSHCSLPPDASLPGKCCCPVCGAMIFTAMSVLWTPTSKICAIN